MLVKPQDKTCIVEQPIIQEKKIKTKEKPYKECNTCPRPFEGCLGNKLILLWECRLAWSRPHCCCWVTAIRGVATLASRSPPYHHRIHYKTSFTAGFIRPFFRPLRKIGEKLLKCSSESPAIYVPSFLNN